MIIDVSEVPCQRPKKKQKRSYSGKQKQHTLKIQIIYNPNINQIISIRTDKGKTHDLILARQYMKDLANYQFVLTNKGYIGLKQKGLITPIKRYKKSTFNQRSKAD